MQTLVRIFYNNQQLLGVVVPDDDSQIDAYPALVGGDERHVDLTNDEYHANMLENGLPDNAKILAYVLAKEATA